MTPKTLGLWVALLLLLLGAGAAYSALERSRRAIEQERHATDVIAKLEEVLDSLQEAERGERGYLYTQQERYLEPYTAATARLPQALGELRDLTRRDAQQRPAAERLDRLASQKLAEMRRTVEAFRAGDTNGAREMVLTDEGRNLMRAARNGIEEMRGEEERARAGLREEALRAGTATVYILLGGGAILSLVLTGSALAIQTGARRQEEFLSTLARGRDNLDGMLSSIGDGVMATDARGRVRFLNPAAERLTGWSLDAARGRDAREVLRALPADATRAPADPVRRCLDEGRVVEYADAPFAARDGSERCLDGSAAPARDRDGGVIGAIAVFRDVTARRQARAELEALNVRLRRSMAETHHRVKNNLQVVSALADMQAQEAGATVPTAALERVGQYARSLAAIHDLLTHEAKAGGETERLRARDVLDRLRPLLASVTGGREVQFAVDDVRLPSKQATALAVLVNELVSNAVKHGGSRIELSLRAEAGRARLTVRDDGAGFPPDFDPRAASNTGLELIESLGKWDLGGEIAFDNAPDGGARVTVAFPVAPEPQSPTPARRTPEHLNT